MLRTHALIFSRQHRRNLSALASQIGPWDFVPHDKSLSKLILPADDARSLSHNFLTPVDSSFLYDASDSKAYQRQLQLEEQTAQTAVERYKRLAEDAVARGDVWSPGPAAALVGSWVGPVALAIRKAQDAPPCSEGGRGTVQQEAQRLLKLLPPDVLTVIIIHEVFGALMRDIEGCKLASLAITVGNAVRAEVNATKLRELEAKQRILEAANAEANCGDADGLLDTTGGKVGTRPRKKSAKKPKKSALYRALMSSTSVTSAVNYAAVQSGIEGSKWSTRDTLLLGTRLIDILVKSSHVQDPGTLKFFPAFRHYKRFIKKDNIAGMLQLEDLVLNLIAHDTNDLSKFLDPKHQPMEVRPRPWISPKNGGYLKTKVELIRARPSHAFDDALAAADMQPLYDGLNALGDTAWRVNEGVLDAGLSLWRRGGGVAGLTSKVDVPVPSKSAFLAEAEASIRLQSALETETASCEVSDAEGKGRSSALSKKMGAAKSSVPKYDEAAALRKLKLARRKARKINREQFSMRADTQYRLDHASAFVGKERFYLPHNVDFRGRAYPIPVFLQHMGADLTRAMLTFANPGVRLGERGVFWLKVHLANLLGADKLSFDERIEVAEDALSRAIEVGRDPLSDRNLEWWAKHEDPFQLLAACQEFAAAAGRYGGERAMEEFYSTLPVSMDGSCNGLQHYAALGRDVLGGQQVNLLRSDRPQDVYTGVAQFVIKKIDEEAAKGDEIAILLRGRVNRKIVKQTVMTSVYGVTLTGAREQVGNRLKEINFPEDKLFAASMMIAKLTLSSLGDIFSGASRTMDWLSKAAQQISKEGHEVQWVTPVGLPVIQPYRKRARSIVKTIMQRVTLEQNGEHMPVSCARQRSAFPPNFVHSIDSSHMLFTAVACQNAGLNYAAVHDSFWTNAGTVDTMNRLLREEFVNLHSRELLTELRESFVMRYPKVTFEELPQRGSLGLQEVLDSPYFFS